jgi:hypothetical protein
MSSNSLPLKDLSINDIFNGSENVKYEIPIYQRNYAWGKDQISELVQDVCDALGNKKNVYYIGTLVTYDKGDRTFEVIDGQQRLTTLYLILKALNREVKNKLTYRARKRSNETIENLPSFDHDFYDEGIKEGYENVVQAIEGIDKEYKEKLFSDYLLYNVRIIHYRVPKDVDLNHYFEVMNSRGEQLEKHEIVKAKLMNVLTNESDKSKFAAIWEACSEMNTYVQTKVGVKIYFEDTSKVFKFYGYSFDDLTDPNESVSKTFTLKSLIYEHENHKINNSGYDDDSKNSMFQPIIDFPNFLLIVLKITRMQEIGFKPNNFTLDDKELINEFNKAMKENPGPDFVKRFCFNLLLIRYLLDNYVVHHANVEETTDDNPWKLQRWQVVDKSRYPKNLAEGGLQDKLVQLLSMFEVSFSARQRKNYLFYILYNLSVNRDLAAYCDFLRKLAKKYFNDIYMVSDCLNEINTPRPGAFDQAIVQKGQISLDISNQDVTYVKFNEIYGDGSDMTKGIPLFVFNYIDFRIWEKYASEMAGGKLKENSEERKGFFRELGCSDFGLEAFNRFYFSRTRRSLEHYYPQALAKKYPDIITEEQINCLGNFAMIGSDANNSGSDWTPKTKLLHYLDSSMKIRQVGVASLKFRIMMQMCRDNDESNNRKDGQEWLFEDIQKHQKLMLNILLEQ